MSKVKICGIRRKEDILYVNKYLPEFVGFVFAQSKRRINFDAAADLVKNLDTSIKKVGVFVNETYDNIIDAINKCDLDVVQVHGDESPRYLGELKNKIMDFTKEKRIEVWKAFRVKDAMSLHELGSFDADGFVLDAFVEGFYGGAGKKFDWSLAVNAKKYGKIILAGGLTSQNVIEARNVVSPMVLDVSSGVETDGFKDEKKISEFICMARSYE
ncbi:MAG TPA: phosphoribosylanthranilate isomerase [Pseudobacteroides sp.]|nr:phosphoribosylanthranilate isomerase [Pseudobacteroides sp.]